MKFLDEVEVIVDRKEYNDEGVYKGMIGTIIDADIRWGSFYVNFQDQRVYDKGFMAVEGNIFKLEDDISLGIKIKDLEVIEKSNVDDKDLYDNLPEKHKDWWCKVEDGYIMNLKGERKNKIPYDYDS